MTVNELISNYISGLPQSKQNDLRELDIFIRKLAPKCKLWFFDGKDENGKTVSNPNIGYGSYEIKYADGKSRAFYRVGISANTTGISVYIMGIKDKHYLAKTFSETIGKASVSGYCIKFKSLKEIKWDVLSEAIRFGFGAGRD